MESRRTDRRLAPPTAIYVFLIRCIAAPKRTHHGYFIMQLIINTEINFNNSNETLSTDAASFVLAKNEKLRRINKCRSLPKSFRYIFTHLVAKTNRNQFHPIFQRILLANWPFQNKPSVLSDRIITNKPINFPQNFQMETAFNAR